jgi:hypothetical protein
MADDANAEQRAYNGGANQKWKFELVEPGYYKVINVNSSKVLDVYAGQTADGTNIAQWTWANDQEQRWSLTPVESYFIVKPKTANKSMSVANASTANGANVEQRGNGSAYNQQWAITEVGCSDELVTKIVPVKNTENAALDVHLRPNPVVSYFDLSVDTKDLSKPINIKVYDANGRVVWVEQIGARLTSRIAADKWAAGIYFVEVTQGTLHGSVKFNKVN